MTTSPGASTFALELSLFPSPMPSTASATGRGPSVAIARGDPDVAWPATAQPPKKPAESVALGDVDSDATATTVAAAAASAAAAAAAASNTMPAAKNAVAEEILPSTKKMLATETKLGVRVDALVCSNAGTEGSDFWYGQARGAGGECVRLEPGTRLVPTHANGEPWRFPVVSDAHQMDEVRRVALQWRFGAGKLYAYQHGNALYCRGKGLPRAWKWASIEPDGCTTGETLEVRHVAVRASPKLEMEAVKGGAHATPHPIWVSVWSGPGRSD